MPSFLPFLIAGASVLQGIQGYQQNKAMAKSVQAQANANIANEQATAKVKKSQLLRQQEIDRGKATAAAAGSGATIGSFDTLFEDNYSQSLMDQALLEYDSKLTQENIRYNAAVEKQQYKSAATSSLIKGVTGAGTSLYTSGAFSSSSPSGLGFNGTFKPASYGPQQKINWSN